jgi:archaemetzincin
MSAKRPITLLTIFFCLFCSCKTNHDKVILIQPYSDFNEKLSGQVHKQMMDIYPNIVIAKTIPLPIGAYYKLRDRYRADSLIKYMSRSIGQDTIVIGMTTRDISTTKDSIADWGIMGLGYCPGNACVVSTFRLSKTKLSDQFYKVALHELGHTLGLKHCPDKTCLMRDAEGGNPLDKEKDFCPSCKSLLKTKGWNL